MQQRAKENREARKRMINEEYRFIMGIVGGYLDLEVSAVEEFVVDSEEVLKNWQLLNLHQPYQTKIEWG